LGQVLHLQVGKCATHVEINIFICVLVVIVMALFYLRPKNNIRNASSEKCECFILKALFDLRDCKAILHWMFGLECDLGNKLDRCLREGREERSTVKLTPRRRKDSKETLCSQTFSCREKTTF
jgi:hypothetical protein